MSRCQTSQALPEESAANNLSSRDWPAGTGVVSNCSSTLGCASLNVACIDAHNCFARSLVLSCQNSTLPFTGPAGAVAAPPAPPHPASAALPSSAPAPPSSERRLTPARLPRPSAHPTSIVSMLLLLHGATTPGRGHYTAGSHAHRFGVARP